MTMERKNSALLPPSLAGEGQGGGNPAAPPGPPLVSVVIPTYNRPDYLRLAIASAVAQSYPNLEIIVHDNASPVDPTGIVETFRDPRITLFRNPRNIGLSANLAEACRKATGKYVAMLGDDDLWHPEFIATLVGLLEEDGGAVVAFCDHDVIDGAGRLDPALTTKLTRRYGRHLLREGRYCPFDEIALVYRSICVLSAAVLRRDAIDWADIPPEIYMGLDLYLAYLYARSGKACRYVPRRLAQYRYHGGSASSTLEHVDSKIGNARDALVYWSRFLRDDAVGRNRRYFEMKRGLNALVIVFGLLRRGDGREALRELWRFSRDGFLPPRIILYHLRYALRLQRATA
jgi:glycosyltransferase involved in cell wall biosynthesis